VIEDRLLHLAREAAQGAVPLDDFASELSLLVKDLRRCFRRIVEMKERRDLSFKALQDIQLAELHCVWLYRKIHLEQAFFKKLHLETRLRSMISADSFDVYQALLEAEDQEREFLRKGDVEINRQLLGENGSIPSHGTM
jgi:hypothetical protein